MIDKENQNFGNRSYAEYEREAKKMNQKVLSELEWMREKEESLYKKQEALLKRQETFLSHEENNSRRHGKTIEQILSNQETMDRKNSRSQRELTEAFTKGVKDFIGIRSSIELKKNPALAASSALRTNTERLVNFEDLPPVFKDIERGLAGITDLFAGKVIDPLLSKVSSGFSSWRKESAEKKFLLENDPRFANKETGKAEVEAYIKERKEALTELQMLETKQARLSELGGYDLSVAEEIKNLKDFLSGKFEQEISKAEKESSESSARRSRSGSKAGDAAVILQLQTIDKTMMGVVTGVSKLDNRLAQIQESLSTIIAFDKRQSLVAEEQYERALKERASEIAKVSRPDSSRVANQEESSFDFGGLTKIAAGAFAGLSSIFGTVTKGVSGLLSVVGGLPSISTTFSTLANVFKFMMRFNPIILGVSAILLAKEFVDMIEELEMFAADGKLSKTGKAIDTINKVLGGHGITPDAEKSRVDMIREHSQTGWWDIGDSKKNQYKKQYLDELHRGGTFTPEEAEELKKGFGIDVGKDKIRAKTDVLGKSPVKRDSAEVMSKEEFLRQYEEKYRQYAVNEVAKENIRKNSLAAWEDYEKRAKIEGATRDMGGRLESSERTLVEAKEAREAAAATTQPVVIAPSSSSVVSNTTALGVRPKARYSEPTFERMTGSRYGYDY